MSEETCGICNDPLGSAVIWDDDFKCRVFRDCAKGVIDGCEVLRKYGVQGVTFDKNLPDNKP